MTAPERAVSSAVVDVAIVGYGPTGATLANLLGQQGLNVVVLEREPAPLDLPRAVHFDGEVARIFQSIGLAGEVLHRSRLSAGMKYFNVAGDTLLERKPSPPSGPQGWPNNVIFHQPDLEAVLRDGVGRFENVDVCLNTQVEGIEDRREHTEIRVRDAQTRQTRNVRARWVVGCDGGRSMVRELIGGGMEDMGMHQAWLVIDAVMIREVELPDITIQYCDPERPITYIHVVGQRRRWEIMLMPGDNPETIVRDEALWRLLAPWIKPGDARLERRAIYTFHALIANQWRHERLILAGDAAHLMPPFLGQGLCSGIRDASNLAWKLAAICRGADAKLLDSYCSERRPHVREFVQTAVRLGSIIQTTDPHVAAERDRRMLAGDAEIVNLSPPLGPGAHGGSMSAGTLVRQPFLSDGSRLDDVTGSSFVLCGETLPRTRQTQALWALVDAGVLVWISDDALSGWLEELGACWVVLRPDRYVLDQATNADAIVNLIDRWSEVICTAAPVSRKLRPEPVLN